MAKLFIQDTTLTAITNAIREKTGNTEPLSILQLPELIKEITGSLPDSENVAFGSDAEFEEEYEITSDRLNEIAAEAKRFARTSEALSPAQIVQSLQEAMDDNLFIEGRVPEIQSETVTKIKPYCFYGDETLAKFDAPNVTSIGVNSFDGCNSLVEVSVPQITSVPNYGFNGCSALANVDMPLITSIGNYGFYKSAMQNISFSELTSIGTYSFAESESLETFNAPKLTTIGASSFFNASNLREINLPEVTTINSTLDYGTFQGTKLVDVNLPKVTSIGNCCFAHVDTLKSVNAPLLTSIAANGFFDCSNLEVLHFPSVTTCGANSFQNCAVLAICDFDKKVAFGDYAFRNCTALEALILRGNTMSTLSSTYSKPLTNSGIELGTGYVYVPRALVDTYKADSKWKTYANQIRAIEDWPDICEGKEVIREYVFDTSKEADYTFDRNYIDYDDDYSLRAEYDCNFAEEEIDSGKMINVSIDINLVDLANIESLEVE